MSKKINRDESYTPQKKGDVTVTFTLTTRKYQSPTQLGSGGKRLIGQSKATFNTYTDIIRFLNASEPIREQ